MERTTTLISRYANRLYGRGLRVALISSVESKKLSSALTSLCKKHPSFADKVKRYVEERS